jgi:hypothetical protein
MSNSKLIAGLMGPLLLAVGFSMLLRRHLFPIMVDQLATAYAVVFISGMLALVAGVAIVRVHNVWVQDWPVAVTIFGWLAIVGGLSRMFFPDRAMSIASRVAHSGGLTLGAIVTLALGAFLTFKGYEEEIRCVLGQRPGPPR